MKECRRRSGKVVVTQDRKVIEEWKGLTSLHDLERAPNGDIRLADVKQNAGSGISFTRNRRGAGFDARF